MAKRLRTEIEAVDLLQRAVGGDGKSGNTRFHYADNISAIEGFGEIQRIVNPIGFAQTDGAVGRIDLHKMQSFTMRLICVTTDIYQ